MKKAILAFDLNACERVCIATTLVATRDPCPHGYNMGCPRALEATRYVFVTSSPAEADTLGKAIP